MDIAIRSATARPAVKDAISAANRRAADAFWRALWRAVGVIIFIISIAAGGAAFAQTVGSVTRVQKEAKVGATTAVEGTPVHMNDPIRSGPGARLEITFLDETKLTLGENANVTIDRYVYNPGTSTGVLLVNASTGALRFATGQIAQMSNKDIQVQTPVAAAAVRGTEFWAGIVDHVYGILLLSDHGKVNVSNSAGTVLLSAPGYGTDIEPSLKEDQPPGQPYEWPADKVARALSQTSFGLAMGPIVPGLAVITPLVLVPALTNDPDRPVSP